MLASGAHAGESTKGCPSTLSDRPSQRSTTAHAIVRHATMQPMDPVLARIQRVTEELNALEQDLQQIGVTNSPGPVPLLDEQTSLRLVSDLKVAVDNVRHFLWAYIEKVADGNRMMLGEALHSARLNRVSAMLRVLNETEHSASAGTPRSISDIVNAVIRHDSPK